MSLPRTPLPAVTGIPESLLIEGRGSHLRRLSGRFLAWRILLLTLITRSWGLGSLIIYPVHDSKKIIVYWACSAVLHCGSCSFSTCNAPVRVHYSICIISGRPHLHWQGQRSDRKQIFIYIYSFVSAPNWKELMSLLTDLVIHWLWQYCI